MNIYYKVKVVGNRFFALFRCDNSSDVDEVFIDNDIDALKSFLELHKDDTFIGGSCYNFDNKVLASIINNESVDGNVSLEMLDNLPLSIDVCQGIVKGNIIKLDTVLCNLGIGNKSCLIDDLDSLTPNDYQNIYNELKFKTDFIKELYALRKDFFDFKKSLIEKYGLKSSAILDSFGKFMANIVGLGIKDSVDYHMGNGNIKFGMLDTADSFDVTDSVRKSIDKDPFYKLLITELYLKGKVVRVFDGNLIKYSKTGISGSIDNYIDTSGNGNYLYIDFNSFGPSILINGNWLDYVSSYADRYEELRNKRLSLKSMGNSLQSFLKNMLNSFIDETFKINYHGINIGKSITYSGAFIMTDLINQLLEYDIAIVDANTDGIIIKVDAFYNDSIKSIVEIISKKYHISCDVDVIKKIVHKSSKDYLALFEDGRVKRIGIFGKAQDKTIQSNSLRCSYIALENYFLRGIPVRETLEKLVEDNDVLAFQQVITRGKNSCPLYVKHDGKDLLFTGDAYSIIVVSDDAKEKLYKKNKLGKIKNYSKYNYELVEEPLKFDIKRVDLDYYEMIINEKINLIEKANGKVLKKEI